MPGHANAQPGPVTGVGTLTYEPAESGPRARGAAFMAFTWPAPGSGFTDAGPEVRGVIPEARRFTGITTSTHGTPTIRRTGYPAGVGWEPGATGGAERPGAVGTVRCQGATG
eukprot:752807-Hanusia_phi.AAC.8